MRKNKLKNTKAIYEKNLRLIVIESILSSIGAGFSMSIMNLFWNSIGMNQKEIGITQMLFTISIVLLDIPMGYVADRFNRRLLNVIGDIGEALTFVLYAFSNSMYMSILAECLLGLFGAMTNGVDSAFIKCNCDKLDETGELFKKVNARINIYKCSIILITIFIGGIVARYSYRLTIGISFIPYFIAGIIALRIKDFCGKKEVKCSNPIRDFGITIKEVIKIPYMKVNLIAYILGKEITHCQVWLFTPILIYAGIPIEIVSLGWVFDQTMRIAGAKISTKMVNKKASSNFAVTILLVVSWIIIVLLKLNTLTVWLYGLNGLAYGIASGTLQIPLQQTAKNEIQTSVMSIASTGARFLYIPLVYIINCFGEIKIQYALIGILVFFIPTSVIVYRKLKEIEN